MRGVPRKPLAAETHEQQNGPPKNNYFKRNPDFLGLETLKDLAK
jgi:hypothetical protein